MNNNDLEAMIKASGDSLDAELELAEKTVPELPTLRLDYEVVHGDITQRATKMITTIAARYHNIESEYIAEKIEVDSTLFSSTLFQLRTSEFALKTIIDDINLGNNTPSVFNSLDRMQKVNTEISKNIQEQIIIMEQKYKVLQSMGGGDIQDGDIIVDTTGTINTPTLDNTQSGMGEMIEDGGFITMGAKKLLQHLTGLDKSDDAYINRQFGGNENEEILKIDENIKEGGNEGKE